MNNARPTNVFIVDDSPAIRARLVQLLEAMDDAILAGEAASASQALDRIPRMRPDSVLLDLNLGDGSGMDLLRRLGPQLPETVFIVLTNHSEPQYRRACERAGARYFLDKSTEFDRVREVIAAIAATRH